MAWNETQTSGSDITYTEWNDMVTNINYRTPGPALIVASSTASDKVKNTADYVCDGMADNVEIQAAITASTGKVILSEGTFNFAATVNVNAHVIIEGIGQERTICLANDGLNDYLFTVNSTHGSTQYRLKFLRLKLSGNMANQTSGGGIIAYGCIQSTFQNCHFENCYNYGLLLYDQTGPGGSYGHHNQVIDCLFDQGKDSSGTGCGLYMRNNDENSIIGCQFQYMKFGIIDETGFNSITSCSFVEDAAGGGTTMVGIEVLDCSRTRIVNCVFDYVARQGIWLKGAFNIVDACAFYNNSNNNNNAYSCILIDYYGMNVITNNTFMASSATYKTKYGIEEVGTSGTDWNLTYGRNIIANNMFLSVNGATSLNSGTSLWGTGSILLTATPGGTHQNQLSNNYSSNGAA